MMKSKREQIFETGMHLFRHKGYASTSMQDIADRLAMKAASLYNHISSKQEILSDILLEGAKLFVLGMEEVQGSQLPTIDKIEKLILLHMRLSIEHTDLMALMVTEWRHLDEAPPERYRIMRDTYERSFRELIVGAAAEGDIVDVDVDLALFSILTTLQRLVRPSQ